MKLYNIYPKKKLKIDMLNDNRIRYTFSFYKYFDVQNPLKLRNVIYKLFYHLNILGRVYIAKEGINAQVSILKENIIFFKENLIKIDENLNNVHINKALNSEKSFWVLQVKVRKFIVSDGLIDYKFNHQSVGKYLQAQDVNRMIDHSNVILVDIRNNYEYNIGRFKNAIHVPGSTFKQQMYNILKTLSKYKNTKIILYCTGGIRCEKATAWLKHNNFKEVYHIKGGIINYINQAYKRNLPIMFQGKNFVFDHRLSERISNHIFTVCYNCNKPCDNYINCKNDTCHKLIIQCLVCNQVYYGFCSIHCRKIINKNI